MSMLKTVVFAVMIMVLMHDGYPSCRPTVEVGIAFSKKARRRSSQSTATVVEVPLNTILDAYPCLSVRLRAFLEAQITGQEDYSKHLDSTLIYELLAYRDQFSSARVRGLVSLIKSMELWEGDLTAFEKFGEDLACFANLKTLRLFCSGLTTETFPDLSSLALTNLELWWCTIDPQSAKLPPSLETVSHMDKKVICDRL